MESTPPVTPEPKPSEMNTWGLVGLILSILGFVTGGVTGPIGLILSLIGLKHPQKGLAIAGVIVGALSSLILAFILSYFGAVACCCGGAIYMGADMAALQMAAKPVVAEALGKPAAEVRIVNTDRDGEDLTGTAVYTDDNTGEEMAIDFSGTARKVDGKWQVSDVTITSEPRVYFDFDSEDDEIDIDSEGNVEEGSDASTGPDDTMTEDTGMEDDDVTDDGLGETSDDPSAEPAGTP